MQQAKYFYALGRRKTAVATIRLFASKGQSTVNDKPWDQAYGAVDQQAALLSVFATAELNFQDHHFTAKVKGSGVESQLGAIRHALARALITMQPELKKSLKTAGFITRDPRMVERKKPGLRKARKAEQYSKR